MSDKSEITKVPKENNLVDEIPGVLPILPLRDIVIFPYMIFPVLVGREQSINAANMQLKTQSTFSYLHKKNQALKILHQQIFILKAQLQRLCKS